MKSTPIILGGSPTDPLNKTVLKRQQHIKAVRYWNKVISDLRKQQASQLQCAGARLENMATKVQIGTVVEIK